MVAAWSVDWDVFEALSSYAYPFIRFTAALRIQVLAEPVSKIALIFYGGVPMYTSAIYASSASLYI
jgi:hypothetical protein